MRWRTEDSTQMNVLRFKGGKMTCVGVWRERSERVRGRNGITRHVAPGREEY